MAPCPTLNNGGESRSSPVPLFAHFHVLTALGGTHLVRTLICSKSPKRRKHGLERQQQLENLEGEQRCLKRSLEQRQVLRTWKNTDELHWGKCFSRTFLFREEKIEVHAIAQSSPRKTWPLAVSPALIPQQPAQSWKGRGLPQCQLQTSFLLRTQQVIAEQGRIFLGKMQSKEFLTFHHDVFAPLKDKQNKTCLNRRDTGRDFNIISNNWDRAFPAGQVSVTCTLEGHNFYKQQRAKWKFFYLI